MGIVLVFPFKWERKERAEFNLHLCGFCSSQACQQSHWMSGHKTVCKNFHGTNARSSAQNGVINRGFKTSAAGGKGSSSIALIPDCGDGAISRPIKQAKDVIFFNGSVDNKLMLWALLIAGSYREMETLSARFCCL